jgi:ribonucleoside-diphosphate reductase alpha chain
MDIPESYVVNRKGDKLPVRFDAITDRNEVLCSTAYGKQLKHVEPRLADITQAVIQRFKPGMTTHELDILSASVCASRSTYHQDYSDLAARIIVSDLQKQTSPSILQTALTLAAATDSNGRRASRLSAEYLGIVKRASKEIDRRIVHRRDFRLNCFAIHTMRRSYLLRLPPTGKTPEKLVERPQHAYMRVALALCVGQADGKGHLADDSRFHDRLETAFVLYELLSTQKATVPSPIMVNAGTAHSQLSSCFLMSVPDDLSGLMQIVKDVAMCSKWSGGLGITLTRMRANGALIRSTGGPSSGIRHYLPLLNKTQTYVNQGGHRKGAFCVYLETWHADIIVFLEMGRLKGVDSNAPDLKYAIWMNDLFMEALVDELGIVVDAPPGVPKSLAYMRAVKKAFAAGAGISPKKSPDSTAGDWYLFSPDKVPDLVDTHGEKFRVLYAKYVKEKKYERVVKASYIMTEWFKTVAQKGNPYILCKDHINAKSNLSHYRTITGSNLCAEITIPSYYDLEYDPDDKSSVNKSEYGTCNLSSIPLQNYVLPDARAKNPGRVRMDWAGLIETAGFVVQYMDRAVDITYSPVGPCRTSNQLHRPLAIGIMGLADVFAMFKYAYGSVEAIALDRAIGAAVYYGAMQASSALGEKLGNFPTFKGSAAEQGLLQPDLWVKQGHLDKDWAEAVRKTTGGALTPGMWDGLRKKCMKHLRNGYVTSNMPTATSSQATGQNECFEPFTSNLYTRRTNAGEFTLLNTHLLRELEESRLWDEKMRRDLIASGGSVQKIKRIPADIRKRFRTARELDQRLLTYHAYARNPFLSQTQSLNYYFGAPELKSLLTVAVLGWAHGLTTLGYYWHTQPAVGALKSSIVDVAKSGDDSTESDLSEGVVCTGEVCTVCSV